MVLPWQVFAGGTKGLIICASKNNILKNNNKFKISGRVTFFLVRE